MVEYRDIPGFPGYRVGSDGTAWTCWQLRAWRRPVLSDQWRRLNDTNRKRGHPRVTLVREGKKYSRFVHRLVLEAFVGPRPYGMQCRHLDGTRTNNRLENLSWGTPRENYADQIRHGCAARGERVNTARLTEGDVIGLRFLAARRWNATQLAQLFQIDLSTSCRIIKRKTWKHVL